MSNEGVFMRRVIWMLFAMLFSSIGGWIWTVAVIQTQVNDNSEKINRMDRTYDTVIEIKTLVGVLVTQGVDFKNELHIIGGIQKHRTSIVEDARLHMGNRKIHK